jgi:hypothetical protein
MDDADRRQAAADAEAKGRKFGASALAGPSVPGRKVYIEKAIECDALPHVKRVRLGLTQQ